MSITINRTDEYVDYNVSAPSNRGYLTIDTSSWVDKPWMFYELPALKFEIYTESGEELVKYQNFTREIRTYNPVYSPLGVLNVTIDIRNVPEEFILRITPIFDNDSISARNMLIENGIEDGEIWGKDQDIPTQSFDLDIEFIECSGEYIPPVTPTHEETITGVPPLILPDAVGNENAVYWEIVGNGVQNGTPSPSSIVPFDGSGSRTAQMFDDDNAEYGKWVNSNGSIATNATYAAGYDIKVGTASEFAIKHYGNKPYSYSMAFYDSNGDFLSRVHRSSPSDSYDTFPVPENAVSARFQVAVNTSVVMTSAMLKAMKLMLNAGSSPLPYEPFGYKLTPTITSGTDSTTVPIYLGQVETVRRIGKIVLTGTETEWYWRRGEPNNIYFVTLPDAPQCVNNAAICTHYPNQDTGTFADLQDMHCLMRVRSAGGINVGFRDSSYPNNNDGATQFKAWIRAEYANGTPVTVWYVLSTEQTGIVNEPLYKIGDYADTVSSTNTGAPEIQIFEGNNTLSFTEAVQPSEVTITYTKQGE